jgi:hypothetical protein
MSAARERLPARRASTTFSFESASLHYTATISRFGDGCVEEIFLSNTKPSSQSDVNARDAGVAASLASQHSYSVDELRRALLRDSQGNASSPLGAALDRSGEANDGARSCRPTIWSRPPPPTKQKNGTDMTDINNDEAIAIQGFKDHFGTCPHCHDFGGFINIGRGHWFFCDEHRVKWCVGSDLFDCWRDQTEKEQRAIYDAKGFGSYQDVVPYSPRLITIETSCGKHFELHVSCPTGS